MIGNSPRYFSSYALLERVTVWHAERSQMSLGLIISNNKLFSRKLKEMSNDDGSGYRQEMRGEGGFLLCGDISSFESQGNRTDNF